jgi:hypothetical protein
MCTKLVAAVVVAAILTAKLMAAVALEICAQN